MNLKSIVQERGTVIFPDFLAERVYMREFKKASGLPPDLARWQSTVDQMLDGVDTDGPIYLMVDQKILKAGELHRRPGVHVDGYWRPEIQAHGGGGHGSTPGHSGVAAAGRWDSPNPWSHFDFAEPEAIILASNVRACMAYEGPYEGAPGDGGDFSHLALDGLTARNLRPRTVYAGNVSMLHETVAVERDCARTLVRLNVPGWTPSEAVQ